MQTLVAGASTSRRTMAEGALPLGHAPSPAAAAPSHDASAPSAEACRWSRDLDEIAIFAKLPAMVRAGGGGDATAEGGRDDLETDETLTIATGGPTLQ